MGQLRLRQTALLLEYGNLEENTDKPITKTMSQYLKGSLSRVTSSNILMRTLAKIYIKHSKLCNMKCRKKKLANATKWNKGRRKSTLQCLVQHGARRPQQTTTKEKRRSLTSQRSYSNSRNYSVPPVMWLWHDALSRNLTLGNFNSLTTEKVQS